MTAVRLTDGPTNTGLMNVGSMNIGQARHRTLSDNRPVEALYLSKDSLPAVEKLRLRCFDPSLSDFEELGFYEVNNAKRSTKQEMKLVRKI